MNRRRITRHTLLRGVPQSSRVDPGRATQRLDPQDLLTAERPGTEAGERKALEALLGRLFGSPTDEPS